MEASEENNMKKHQVQQLSFNSLQVVLSIAMVAVGTSVSSYFDMGYFYYIISGINARFKCNKYFT